MQLGYLFSSLILALHSLPNNGVHPELKRTKYIYRCMQGVNLKPTRRQGVRETTEQGIIDPLGR